MHLVLVRYAYLTDCTLGRLFVRGRSRPFETIERPWIPNPAGPGGMPSVSCVPDGEYRLGAHDSPRFPGTYILENVDLGVYRYARPIGQSWGRTAIVIHAANRATELLGCIAPGLSAAIADGAHVVYQSRAALEELRALVPREEPHGLLIRPPNGTEE